MVLIRRSSWTGEGAGMIDRPGGHAEPDEALKVIEEYNHELGEWFENVQLRMHYGQFSSIGLK